MKAQQQDFQRLALMDAELKENQADLDADINSILKKPRNLNMYGNVGMSKDASKYTPLDNDFQTDELECEENSEEEMIPEIHDKKVKISKKSGNEGNRSARNAGNTYVDQYDDEDVVDEENPQDELQKEIPKAPQAAHRYLTSKVKTLTKQVEDGVALRRQLSDQMADLQRQLKTERDENKRVKKRVEQLEAESKRTTASRRGSEQIDPKEVLTQEVATLRKDLQTAERLLKQAETDAKAKDAQHKRALESITRLKAQLVESQTSTPRGGEARGRVEELEAQVKALEKQRGELLTAFRKQMKLIDVLKRQKVHTHPPTHSCVYCREILCIIV